MSAAAVPQQVSQNQQQAASNSQQKTDPASRKQESPQPSKRIASDQEFKSVLFGDRVQFNPQGNPGDRLLAFAIKDPSAINGTIDLVVIDAGGIRTHRAVPHVSQFEKLRNPRLREMGSWQAITNHRS